MSLLAAFTSAKKFDTVSNLLEGVRDEHVLKAIFVLGAGGSGKTGVADAMFAGFGLKTINQDRHLERFLQDAGVPLEKAGSRYDLFKKAQSLKGKELRHYAQRRMGLIVDVTGWDYERVFKPAKKLRKLGYDVYGVFVAASLQTAMRRNTRRAGTGGRGVPPSYIRTAHEGVTRNLKRYVSLFGKENFFLIDNDKTVSMSTWKILVAPALRKIGSKIAARPIKNPVGKKWIEKQQTEPDIDDPARADEWPEEKPKPYLYSFDDLAQKLSKTGLRKPRIDPTGATEPARKRRKREKRPKTPKMPKKPASDGSVAVQQGGATVTIGKKLLRAFFAPLGESEKFDTVSNSGLQEGTSKIPSILYHGTDAKSAASIRRRGVDMRKSAKGYYGRGFYMATDAALAKSNYADFSGDDEEAGVVLAFRVNPKARILNLNVGHPEDWKVWKDGKFENKIHRDDFDKIAVEAGIDGLWDEGSFGGIVIYNPKMLKFIRVEEVEEGGIPLEEKSWKDNPKDFRNVLQIQPEKKRPNAEVLSIGKSKKNSKWYGWSHRAYRGFGVGDKLFVNIKIDWSRTDKTWDELSQEEKDRRDVATKGKKIKTDVEARESAIAFADSVS